MMDLGSEHMSPPRTFAELIQKYTVSHYILEHLLNLLKNTQ